MGTNWVPLLAFFVLYSYESTFIQSLIKAGEKRNAEQLNFTFGYRYNVYARTRTQQ